MDRQSAETEIALWDAMIEKSKELIRASNRPVPAGDADILTEAFGIAGALGRKGPGSQPWEIAAHAEYIAALKAGDLDFKCRCGKPHA